MKLASPSRASHKPSGFRPIRLTRLRVEITAIITIGIDLAKTIFAVHGVGESGKHGQDDAADAAAIFQAVARSSLSPENRQQFEAATPCIWPKSGGIDL